MSQQGQSVKHLGGNRSLTHDPGKLRRRRFAAELSIRDLSGLSGVSTGTISSLERGAYSGKLITLQKLARPLGCTVADFLPDEQNGTAA